MFFAKLQKIFFKCMIVKVCLTAIFPPLISVTATFDVPFLRIFCNMGTLGCRGQQ